MADRLLRTHMKPTAASASASAELSRAPKADRVGY